MLLEATDEPRPIGIITVDDVLELIAPPPGRGFDIFGGSYPAGAAVGVVL